MLHRISKLILAAFCMMAACSFLCGKTSSNGKDVKMNNVLSQPFFVNICLLFIKKYAIMMLHTKEKLRYLNGKRRKIGNGYGLYP
jgi:hypothetical protein